MVDNDEKQLRPLLVSFFNFLFQLFRKVAFVLIGSMSLSVLLSLISKSSHIHSFILIGFLYSYKGNERIQKTTMENRVKLRELLQNVG